MPPSAERERRTDRSRGDRAREPGERERDPAGTHRGTGLSDGDLRTLPAGGASHVAAGSAIRIAIISDTHLKGGQPLPAGCAELARDCDVVIHAGDFSDVAALDEVEALGPPLVAVYGNVDSGEVQLRLGEEALLEAGGRRICIVHDAGPAKGRLRRMRRRFPEADAVIFGHSHMPLHEEKAGFQIFNPGSPTQRRRAPAHTMGMLEVIDGDLRFRQVDLD